MKNFPVPIRMLTCLTAVMLLLIGCEEQAQMSAQSQVVRKHFADQAKPSEPTPQRMTGEAPNPASPGPETSPAVAEVKPQEAAAPPPAPTPANPVPKPKEPAPPTRTVDTASAPAVSTADAHPPVVAAQKAAYMPAAQVRMASREAAKAEAAGKASEAQIAALLNIQAPPPYRANGKVDPFVPLLRDESIHPEEAKLLRKKRDPQSPLEKIDLGQLKLVAIIAAMSGNRAVVEEASGKGYILREGTYVGMNAGKVVDITLDRVLIEEEFEDIYGKSVTQKKEITLPKPPGEL
jgi:Tfp pilus assembly protein PilP